MIETTSRANTVCEALLPFMQDGARVMKWSEKPVIDLLKYSLRPIVRCRCCGEEGRLHNASKDNKNPAHFEHTIHNLQCPDSYTPLRKRKKK